MSPLFFLARFASAIIEVEGPPKNILKEERLWKTIVLIL